MPRRPSESSTLSEGAKVFPGILATTTGIYAIIGGIITLMGWAIPFPRFTDWGGRGISMFPNAALCSIAGGIALLLLNHAKERSGLCLATRVLALFTALIGGLTLSEHLTDFNLGIDEFLFEGTWGQAASTAPMRIGLPASTSFLIIGIALVLATGGRRPRCMAGTLAMIPIAIASLSVVGYLFGASQLFGVARYTGISWQTGTIIIALGAGLVGTLRECGFMAFLLRQDAGGLVARWLFVPIIAIPLLLGWMRLLGEDYGHFDEAFGAAIRTLLEIGLFLLFIWWTANSISRQSEAAREATEALYASEERFTRFMQSLPGLTWIKDTGGRYVYANDSALRAYQKGPEELYGLTDADILPEDTAAEFMENDQRALLEPAGLQLIETMRQKDGLLHSSLVSKFPIPARDGTPSLLGGIAIDITDRLRAEEELKEADVRKDEFLATLAHELRNPLSPIRFSVEICRSQTDPAKRARALDIVDRQVQQMSRLLDDLLDVSRISYGKLNLRPERIELSSLFASAAETSQPLREEVSQTLALDLPEDPVFLNADPVRLEQIFSNLLNNAAKYGGKGSHVVLTATTTPDSVCVSIRDNGAGIPPDRLADIFEMFSQVKPAGGGSHGGLGIGLSLVQGLVRLHAGEVEARSEGLGHGSEFIVRLPRLPGDESADDPAISAPPGTTDGKSPQRPLRPLRLLIADDLRDSADSLTAYFRSKGHEVRTAYDGGAALDEAMIFRPDLVFLDIGMPKLSGHDVCRRIREEGWGKEIFIVAITGWGQESDRRLTTEAGFDRHLVKPVEIGELNAIVSGAGLKKAGK
jgi:PAS domain S-box-containing protein